MKCAIQKNLKPGTLIIIISNFAFHYTLYTLEIFAGSVPKVMQNISNFKGRLNPQFQKKDPNNDQYSCFFPSSHS